MFTPARFQVRSWMFIYIGLIAAVVVAGQPADAGTANTDLNRAPAVIVDSPLLRRDI